MGKPRAVYPTCDNHKLGRAGYLIYLREVFSWLTDHVDLMAPESDEFVECGLPELVVTVPWEGLPTFSMRYEALLSEPRTMGQAVDDQSRFDALHERAG